MMTWWHLTQGVRVLERLNYIAMYILDLGWYWNFMAIFRQKKVLKFWISVSVTCTLYWMNISHKPSLLLRSVFIHKADSSLSRITSHPLWSLHSLSAAVPVIVSVKSITQVSLNGFHTQPSEHLLTGKCQKFEMFSILSYRHTLTTSHLSFIDFRVDYVGFSR